MRYLCANDAGEPTAVALDSVVGQTFSADPETLTWKILNADDSVARSGRLVEVEWIDQTAGPIEACSERTQLAGTDLWGPCVEPKGHAGAHQTVRALC